jgi:hypothetical protein
MAKRTGGRRRMLAAWVAGVVWMQAPARAEVVWGGSLPEDRTQNLRVMIGSLLEFEGMISETTRRFYDVTGRPESQADAESYNSSDFNLDGPFGALGLSLDMAWSFLRLQLDTLFMSPSATATARRDYYIAVGDDIAYGGQTYERMQIPEGRKFSTDLTGNMTELVLMLVPVGFTADDYLHINPGLAAGLLFFGGSYDIDAGPATGVVTYQNPPEQFVVGGKSGGFVALGVPQWGPGLDVRVGSPGEVQASFQAHYLLFDYDGGTGYFSTSEHREKNVDFRHRNLRLRGQVEFPLRRVALSLGVQAQWIETEGLISSRSTDPDEIIRLRERFDKEFTFRASTLLATVGLVF